MILNIWVKNMNKNTNKLEQIVTIILLTIILAVGAYFNNGEENQTSDIIENDKISYEISNIPEYNGQVYVEINNNNPTFTVEDINIEEDFYSTLKNGRVRNGNGKNLLGKS